MQLDLPHSLIRVLDDGALSAIRVESVALPGRVAPTEVDDVVIAFSDGHGGTSSQLEAG